MVPSLESSLDDRETRGLGWVLLIVLLPLSMSVSLGCLRSDPESSSTPPPRTRVVVDAIVSYVPPPKPTPRPVQLHPKPTPAAWSYRDEDLGIAFPVPHGFTVSRRAVEGFSGFTSLELADKAGNSISLLVDVHGDFESTLESGHVYWKGGWWCPERGGMSNTYPVEAKNGQGLWCEAFVGIHNEHGYAGLGTTYRATIGGPGSVVVKVSTSTGDTAESFRLLIGGFEFLTPADAE